MRLLALAVLAALSGCGMTPYESPPADVPSATVSFRQESDAGVFSTVIIESIAGPVGSCDDATGRARVGVLDRGNPLVGNDDLSDVRVAAGQPFTFIAAFVGMPSGWFEQNVCSHLISFSPAAGRAYDVVTRVRESACDVRIADVSGGQQPVAVALAAEVPCQ